MKHESPMQWRVILTRQERLTLIQHVPLDETLRNQLTAKDTARPVEVWMAVEQADLLRERVADGLQTRGFDESYATTPIGKVLESLIDRA